MANYKPSFPDYVDHKGYVHTIKKGDKLIHLTCIATSSPDDISMHDINVGIGTDYQVPTGKKFIIINAKYQQHLISTSYYAYYSDDADAETNPVMIMTYPTGLTDLDLYIFDSVPEGKYINWHSALTNKTLRWVGWEVNA